MEINRIRDISTFVTTVKYGSYTRAAKHLGVTRSTVGKSIVRLEQAMGVRLLNRTTRSLSTTDEGKVFYEYSHSIMEELNTMTSVMDSRRAYPTGTLRLTAPHSLGHTYILPLLTTFLKKWPNLKADISFTDRFIDLAKEGFDIGVRVGEATENSRIMTRTVAWHQMQVCASPEFLAQYGTPQTPQQLANFNTIFFENESGKRRWKFQGPDEEFIFDAHQSMKIDSAEAILASGLAGFGIIYLPTFLTHAHVHRNELKVILGDYEAKPEPIRIIYSSKEYLSPRIRQFIDFMVEQWGDNPPWTKGVIT